MEQDHEMKGRIVGGVDTHKDLHVAAVVDERDRVLASRCFPTTRHAPVESFFASPKTERVHGASFCTTPQPSREPAWRRSLRAPQNTILIPPLHAQGEVHLGPGPIRLA